MTVNTGDSTLATIAIDDDEFLMLAGRKLAVMVRGDEDGADNIDLRTGVDPGGGYYYTSYLASDWIASGTSVSIDLSPEIFAMPDEAFYRLLNITRAMSVRVQGKRPTGDCSRDPVHWRAGLRSQRQRAELRLPGGRSCAGADAGQVQPVDLVFG